MPSLTLSMKYNADPVVVQSTYDWIFSEPIQQIKRRPEFYDYNTFFVSAGDLQLEMFPQQTVIEDYFVFKLLVDQWRKERGATSSITEMVLCPAYQSIIGMGPKAIRFILTELSSEGDDPDHWFWALQALTRANPVSEEDEGNLGRMSRA
ncbi:MAG: hypothetical protein WCD68_06700, partial [Candidatus Acidiferrum sp.]